MGDLRRVLAVIGTAGHVDHGKTSLVRALTGMETDRLPEERARGISIELGFAWLDRPAGRVAFIDVPGHERFVRQMVAGASGIDAVVLVVAADEGVMPQTREHLDICGLLGLRHGLVVLSRADLVEPAFLELAREDVASAVGGTFLEGARVVTFSIHDPATAARVTDALDLVIAAVVPDDLSDRPFLLAIDRAFSRPGFGTIVTGTSRSGVLAVGDEVLVHHPEIPAASSRPARVRGLEVHGEATDRVAGGRRVAVNLSGVSASDLPRGARLAHVGLGEPVPASMWDVEVEALARLPLELPDGEKGLACFGASVVEASLGLLDRAALAPGERTLAQLRLAEPLALLPGERWIFRGFRELADGATLGGGRVLAPSARRRRHAQGIADLDALSRSLPRALEAYVAAAAEGGVPWPRLHAALPWPRAAIDAEVRASALVRSTADGHAILVAPQAIAALATALDETLEAFHRAEPAAPGIAADELRTRLRPTSDAVVFDALLDALARERRIVRRGAHVARAGFSPTTSVNEDALDRALLETLTRAGLMPPKSDELAPLVDAPQAKVDAALVRLVARKAAVRVQKDMAFAASALAELEAKVRTYFSREEWLDAQALKELTGATRKWSIPLGEWLDRAHVTVRVGERRRLRKS